MYLWRKPIGTSQIKQYYFYKQLKINNRKKSNYINFY
jgi:hypothetical protein